MADDDPIVKLVNLILIDALKKEPSEIHVEPQEDSFRVYFRIDGALHEAMQPPMKLREVITSRLKLMAELDDSEQRRSQDASLKIRIHGGEEADFSVSVRPTPFGEKVVLRVLARRPSRPYLA